MLSRRHRGFLTGLSVLFLFLTPFKMSAVIRDGGIDPANLGKGEWIYSMKDATNKLAKHVPSVVNEATLFQYYNSIGVRYIIVKMGTGSTNYGGCYGSPNQITAKMIGAAHSNNVWVFGYTRSYGSDIAGESALADYCFNTGADGFVFDAEAEWESNKAWIGTNGPALAWQLCSMVRSNWPNKFIAHAPFPIISFHTSFPYKEFGYWCDAIMPQIYHFSAAGLQGSASAAINWSDVNWRSWQNSLVGSSSVINGQTIYWTNAIKPILPLQDVYGEVISGGNLCNGAAGAVYDDKDILEFMDYSIADPNCVTATGYNGLNIWRADLAGVQQRAYFTAGTSGNISNIVSNIVIDDARATRVGAWTKVLVFSSTTTTPAFTGDGSGLDNRPFGTNYWTKGQGTGSAYMQFRPTVVTAGDYNVYQWHANKTNASSAVPVSIDYDGGSANFTVNQTTNPGNWSLIARLPFAEGTNGTIRFTDDIPEADAVTVVDGLKMVFVPPTAVPSAPSPLTATAAGTSQINLTWNESSTNETGFIIFRSTTNGGPYSAVAKVGRNSTAYNDTNLLSSTTYYYVVRGTNYLGLSAASPQANATTMTDISSPPTIVTDPASQTVAQGSNALFSVTAAGSSPFFYQWRFNGNTIIGAINSSYTRNNVQPADAGGYSVIVTNTFGSVTSSVATLTVVVPAGITSQPQSRTNLAGTTATFTVGFSGSSPTFQWKRNGLTLLDGGSVTGATTATLQIDSVAQANAGTYTVVVSNLAGVATSSGATLTVIDPPLFTLQPQGQTVALNEDATFSVAASGSAPLSFQWRFKNSVIAGATLTSYTVTKAKFSDGGAYSVVVSNSAGSVASSSAILTVLSGNRVLQVSNIWNIQAGSRTYVTSNNTERGLCLNPLTGHALLVSRSALLGGGLGIFVLDANTGAEVGTMNTNGINNTAIFKLNKIDVADDGVIYGANLTTSSGSIPFIIYRWANEDAAPSVAYTGAPDSGTTPRWGDSFSVTGAGANTRILVSGSGATNAIVFTTSNGTNFTPNAINPTQPVPAAEFARGVDLDFDKFHVKNRSTNTAKVYNYDLTTKTAAIIGDIDPLDTNMLTIVAITNYSLIAGVIDDNTTNQAGHSLKVYDVANPSSPVVVSNFNFLSFGSGTNSPNLNFAGSVDTDGERIVGLDTQNGVVALQILVSNPPPHINSVLLLSGNRRQFELNVDPGSFVIQASSTLTNWNDFPVTRTNGLFEITDPSAESERFYRVKTL